MNELYKRLSVTPSATDAEIKRAYRTLAKQLHPDLHPDYPQAVSYKQLTLPTILLV